MNRAYSWLEIKSIDRAQRIIEGIASTPEVDIGNDALDPAGAEFTLPMPFLLEHGDPLGEVFSATSIPDGIYIKAQIAKVDPSAPSRLRDRINTAWAEMTSTPPMRRGLSVGWKPLESKVVNGIRRVSRWILGEVSAVVVPMNAHARITSVKSLAQFDRASALSGARSVSSTSGVPDRERTSTVTISEQLTAERNNLQVKSARLEELINDETTNGSLEEAEATEKETLIAEVKSLTGRVSQLTTLEQAQAAQALGLVIPTPAGRTHVVPGAKKVEFKSLDLPKGTLFTRVAMAVAAGRGSESDTLAYAKRFTNTPEVALFVKQGLYRKDALPGTAIVESPGWGGELVNPNTMLTQFIEMVMPRTIIGRVQGFDRVPFNIPFIEQTGGSTFNWVGEKGVKGVGELAFERNTIAWSKVAGIVVLTEELIRLSLPSAEEKVRADMVKQCAKFLDQQFIQVAISAGANNPASITNGVASPTATGTTAAALRHDLNIALATFDTLNESSDSDSSLVIVMTPALARGISLLTTTLGVPEFPTITPQGGTLLGYPVIVSSSVDSGTIVVFQPSEIYLASDDRVTLDASREATLDMGGGSSPDFNLWQNNCIGLRAEQWIRWQKKRVASGTECVAVIDTAAYAPA